MNSSPPFIPPVAGSISLPVRCRFSRLSILMDRGIASVVFSAEPMDLPKQSFHGSPVFRL